MRILVDIGHPGHVHLFRPFAMEMKGKGHQILFTCREKEFEVELLREGGLEYVSFGKKYKSTLGKVFGLLKFDILEFLTARKFKPHLFLSHGSPYAAHVAWLLRRPHISFEDTFNFEQIRLYKSFSDVILTSTYKHPDLGKNNLHYDGYHELAYLHPNRFKPDENVLGELGLKPGEKYVIMRFVSWNATHDIGHKGMSSKNKILAAGKISKYAKVFISSENVLPPELEKYRFPLGPQRMHHAIAFASLVYGESATMATEGAVLGVPGIYLDNTSRLYTKDIESNFGLIFNYSESEADQQASVQKAIEVIQKPGEEWIEKRKKLLEKKIDVTKFLVWFIENYPESKSVAEKNSFKQLSFK